MALISGYECVTRRGRSFSLRLSLGWTLPSDLCLYQTLKCHVHFSGGEDEDFGFFPQQSAFCNTSNGRNSISPTNATEGCVFNQWDPKLSFDLGFTQSKGFICVIWGMFTCMLLWFGQGHLMEGLFFNEAIPLSLSKPETVMHDIDNIYQNVQQRAKLAWFFFLLLIFFIRCCEMGILLISLDSNMRQLTAHEMSFSCRFSVFVF